MVYKFYGLIYYTGNCSLSTHKLRKIKDGEIISGLAGGLPFESYFDSDEVVYPPTGTEAFGNCRAYWKNTMFPTSEGWSTTNPPNPCNGLPVVIEVVTIPSTLRIRKEKNCYYTQFTSHVKISCGVLSRGLKKYLIPTKPTGSPIFPNDHNWRTPFTHK